MESWRRTKKSFSKNRPGGVSPGKECRRRIGEGRRKKCEKRLGREKLRLWREKLRLWRDKCERDFLLRVAEWNVVAGLALLKMSSPAGNGTSRFDHYNGVCSNLSGAKPKGFINLDLELAGWLVEC